jgi:hypothetical protein
MITLSLVYRIVIIRLDQARLLSHLHRDVGTTSSSKFDRSRPLRDIVELQHHGLKRHNAQSWSLFGVFMPCAYKRSHRNGEEGLLCGCGDRRE